jgi:hypothetical protein
MSENGQLMIGGISKSSDSPKARSRDSSEIVTYSGWWLSRDWSSKEI